MRVAPWLAAAVWSSVLFLARVEEARAQDSDSEEAGDDAQEVTAFAQGGTSNGDDDV